MAYCRECGAPIDEAAKFCPECGTPANGETVTAPVEASPPPTPQPSNAKPKKKATRRQTTYGCLTLVGIVVIIVAVVALATSGHKTNVATSPTPTPVRLTAKETREYKLIAAFLPRGKKIENTEWNARTSADQSQADALTWKALDLYAGAVIAMDKDGFFSKHVRAGGAVKQLEKLFLAYRDNLTGEIYAKSRDEFAFFYPQAQVARERVQAELNRIAGIQ